MLIVDFYLVDAFTQHTFGGNAAAVCPLTAWLPNERLLQMARQHNQKRPFLYPQSRALRYVGLPRRVKSTCVDTPRWRKRM